MRYLQIILTAGLIWTQFSADAQAVFLGPAATDEGSFTAGTSPFQPQGCFFQTTATSNPLTTGQQGSVQCTAQRAPFVNLRNSSGTEIGTSGSPLFTSLSATPSLANGNGIVQTQGGSVLSATNGTYANLLQGNAVISTGNPLFITGTGTAGTAATNPITVQGIASMTPLLANPGTPGTWGLVAVGGAAAPTNGMVAGGIFNTTLPTITATNGAAFQIDGFGRLIEAPKTILSGTLVKGTTAAMTGTTSTQVIALVSSQRLYVTAVHCTNSSATVPTLVSIQDGSGGTVLDTLSCNDNFGGDERNNGTQPLFWTTSGNGLYAADVTTGASVIVTASGYSSAN
jgi:hypothetical protein